MKRERSSNEKGGNGGKKGATSSEGAEKNDG